MIIIIIYFFVLELIWLRCSGIDAGRPSHVRYAQISQTHTYDLISYNIYIYMLIVSNSKYYDLRCLNFKRNIQTAMAICVCVYLSESAKTTQWFEPLHPSISKKGPRNPYRLLSIHLKKFPAEKCLIPCTVWQWLLTFCRCLINQIQGDPSIEYMFVLNLWVEYDFS